MFQLKNVPPCFERLVDELPVKPSQSALVNLYIRCKALHTQEDAVESLFLKTLETELLTKDLKPFRLIKLLFRCPELLPGREEKFSTAIKSFEQQLISYSAEEKLFWRAQKVSAWVRSNPTLQSHVPISLDFTLTSSDGQAVAIDRFSWAQAIPAWRPMLLGRVAQDKDVDLSAKLLQVIDQYIKESTLPNLDYKELLKLLSEAESFEFEALKKACSKALIESINEDTVLILLRRSLELRSEPLIMACLQFLQNTEEDISLGWDAVEGLSVTLHDLSGNITTILDCISQDIYRITFKDPKAIRKFIEMELVFPQANGVNFHCDCEPTAFNSLSTFFPNAKSCSLDVGLYQKLQPEHVLLWTEIETIHVNSQEEFELSPLFPKVKLALRQSKGKFEIQVRDGICFCQLGIKGKKSVDLSVLGPLLTDQMLIDLIHYLPKSDIFILNDCTTLTTESAKAILKHLIRRVAQLKKSQPGTFESMIQIHGIDPKLLSRITKLTPNVFPEGFVFTNQNNRVFFELNWCLANQTDSDSD